jgi:hypothetical protein
MNTHTDNWDYQGDWLNYFPRNTHSTIINLFCYAVREGCETEMEVLQNVEYQARRRRGRNNSSCLTDEWIDKLVIQLLDEEAGNLAAHILWRERLPQDERAKLKAKAGSVHVAAYMAQHPPTEKQLSYLRRLGCKETPKSRQEASEWIDARVGK